MFFLTGTWVAVFELLSIEDGRLKDGLSMNQDRDICIQKGDSINLYNKNNMTQI